jgi:hypothetical protein
VQQQQQQWKRQISQTDGIVPIDVSAYRTYKPEIGRKAAEFTHSSSSKEIEIPHQEYLK